MKSAIALLVGLIALLGVGAALPWTAPHPVVAWTWATTAAALAIWLLVLHRTGRIGPANVVILAPHWVQACMQGVVFVWWSLHVEEVARELPLILLQVPLVYVVDALLSWSRGRAWRIGFGPFPMVGSVNLFLWFVDPLFYWQIAMIVGVVFGREFIRWERGGRSRHIFNPSGLVLTVASVFLLVLGTHDATWGQLIAKSLHYAPYMYDVLFGVGLVVMFLFRTTLVTAGAAVALWLLDLGYNQATGGWLFIDTSIPIAVFLGMNLLITDPATSPSGRVGKAVFGALYGLAVYPLFWLLPFLYAPAFYDKLLQVPVLNLLTPLIDRATRRLKAPGPRADRIIWVAWIGVYLLMRPWLVDHPGSQPDSWRAACESGSADACMAMEHALLKGCDLGRAEVCFEFAQALADPTRLDYDASRAALIRQRACELGHAPACAAPQARAAGDKDEPDARCDAGDGDACVQAANAWMRAGERPRAATALQKGCDAKNAVACADLGLMAIRGDGVRQDMARSAALHQRACDLKLAVACGRLAEMYERGMGVEVDRARARSLYRQACAAGDAEACRRSAR